MNPAPLKEINVYHPKGVFLFVFTKVKEIGSHMGGFSTMFRNI